MTTINKSEYLLKLEKDNKEVSIRYKGKLRVISCMDPYNISYEEMDTSLSAFPAVTYFDIITYLVLMHSFYTAEQMKAFKSLSGYTYFEAGFVHQLGAKKIGENIVVTAKVKHSQSMNEPPLNVWVISATAGSIISAHCTCMPGISEVCSHISAVLYSLEYIQTSFSNTACTDVKAEWIFPNFSNVPLVELNEMKLRKSSEPESSVPMKDSPPVIEGEELVNFLQ